MTETLQMPLGLNMAPTLVAPPLPARTTPPNPPTPAAAPPTVPLPIAMQPRVKAPTTPSPQPTRSAATLSESGLRTSEDFAARRANTVRADPEEAEESHALAAGGALSTSIVGLFACPLIMGVVAVCMGVWALSEMKCTGNADGRRSAVFGLFIGLMNVAFWVVYAMASFGEDLAK